MALDGIVVHSICTELKNNLINGRVDKVHQPEKDEIIVKIRNNSHNYKLLITSNSSSPRMHFTNVTKENPISAPMFCMLLRKHLSGAKIIDISQLGFDRIIEMKFECKDELRTTVEKSIIVEIMGKHSNIIFIDKDRKVIDSIKRVSENMSSVRQIYPGKEYLLPPTQDKVNPLEVEENKFIDMLKNADQDMNVYSFTYKKFQGFSSLIGKEICFRAKINEDACISNLIEHDIKNLYDSFRTIITEIESDKYTYKIFRDKKKNFHSIKLSSFDSVEYEEFDTVSELLDFYFNDIDNQNRINQKVYGLMKNISNKIDRDKNKLKKRHKELEKAENREKYRIYADLLMANLGTEVHGNEVEVINYYDEEMNKMIIPLDHKIKDLKRNAQKYYKKYEKLKNAEEELVKLIEDAKKEIEYLENIEFSIGLCKNPDDIDQINAELSENGYIKKYKVKKSQKKLKITDKILVYESSFGHEIYVGRNNIQNDYITFKIADKNDYWFHSKGIPGSHVVIKTNNDELEDIEYMEAARLAAYYSNGRNNKTVEIDYTKRLNLKKPSNAMLGFVIFHTNYSMNIDTDISNIKIFEK